MKKPLSIFALIISVSVFAGMEFDPFLFIDGFKNASAASANKATQNYTQDFVINSALNGYVISNHGSTQDIKGTFASDLPDGFSCRIINEVGGLLPESILFHADFEGVTTSMRDRSRYNRIITPVADATQSATQHKFGNNSLYVDGTLDCITIVPDSNFNFGTGDFTFEYWVYFNAFAGNTSTFGNYVGTSNVLSVWTDDSNGVQSLDAYTSDGTRLIGCNSGNLSLTTWTHIAVVRYGNSIKLYVNGTAGSPIDVTGKSFNIYANSPIKIGGASTYYVNAYIDEFTIYNTAKYTGTFTPSETSILSGYTLSKLTIAPPSGSQLPGTSAINRNLVSSAFGDSLGVYKTANSFIGTSVFPVPANWVDTAQP